MDVHIETTINANAEKTWAVLAHHFADIEKWSTTVEHSRPMKENEVPANLSVAEDAPLPGRVTTTRIGTLKEVLTSYSDSERDFIFTGVDLPPFLTHAHNHSRVVETGDGASTLTFDIVMELRGPFKLLGPIMSRRFHRTYGLVQADLKYYLETGKSRTRGES